MPTDTDPNLPSVDSPTAATPAYRTPPVVPAPRERYGELADQPGPLEDPDPPVDPATLTTAEWLDYMQCGCGDPDNTEEHDGWNFRELGDAWEARVLAAAIRAGVVVMPGRAPVEAKVWAGTWGTLGATMGLALVTLLLDRLDVIPSLLGGQHPWAGPLVLVLGVVLPPAASFLRGFLAAHTPRVTP